MRISSLLEALALQHNILTSGASQPLADFALRTANGISTDYNVKSFARPLTPSVLAQAAKRALSEGTPLFVTPRISTAALKVAEQVGVSVLTVGNEPGAPITGILFDAAGGVLRFNGPDTSPDTPRTRRGKVAWGTYATAFTLLQKGKFTQTELAKGLGISQPRVSQILKALNVATNPLSPVDLSDWLAENYPTAPRAAAQWATLDTPRQTAKLAAELLTSAGIPYAVSGDVAADHYAPWARPQTAFIWARTLVDFTEITATPTEDPDAANLQIAVPADPYLLSSVEAGAPPSFLTPWRVWVDLKSRQRDDAAEALRAKLIDERRT